MRLRATHSGKSVLDGHTCTASVVIHTVLARSWVGEPRAGRGGFQTNTASSDVRGCAVVVMTSQLSNNRDGVLGE